MCLAPLNWSKPAGRAAFSLSAPGLSGLFTQRGKEVCRQKTPCCSHSLRSNGSGSGVVVYSLESQAPLRKQTPLPPFWPQSVIFKTASRLQLSGGMARKWACLSRRRKVKGAQTDRGWLCAREWPANVQGHQATILVSVPGAPAAVAWEVSSGRSGLADIFGSWRAVGT